MDEDQTKTLHDWKPEDDQCATLINGVHSHEKMEWEPSTERKLDIMQSTDYKLCSNCFMKVIIRGYDEPDDN